MTRQYAAWRVLEAQATAPSAYTGDVDNDWNIAFFGVVPDESDGNKFVIADWVRLSYVHSAATLIPLPERTNFFAEVDLVLDVYSLVDSGQLRGEGYQHEILVDVEVCGSSGRCSSLSPPEPLEGCLGIECGRFPIMRYRGYVPRERFGIPTDALGGTLIEPLPGQKVPGEQ